jgi:RNA polymerase sigma factor (sigma-70 family)
MKKSSKDTDRHSSLASRNSFHFQEFVQGSESSFAYIYGHLGGMIRRYGLRMVQDEFVVNTILQEAFLKTWAFRERMTSMTHITRFLKLTMRWECMGYYRRPIETLYRKAIRLNWIESWEIAAPESEEDIVHTENHLHILRSMIPHLPDHRQRTIVSLYAKDGMPVSQIAQQLHISPQVTGKELSQGLDRLRSMLVQPKSEVPRALLLPTIITRPIKGLNSEQTHIITMRRDMRYTFGQIADLLKLPQPYVQRQYVEAWKKCGQGKDAKQSRA